MQKTEISGLTGLRFAAAFAIVLDHLWPIIFKFDRLAVLNNAVHQLAYVGMSLFFVLSGFIIHYNYAEIVGRPGGLWQFFVARFSRLYPLYLLVLALDFALYRPPMDGMALRMLTMTQSWTYQFSDGRFLPYGYHFSVVSWSISTEVFFYVVYPMIAPVVRRLPALTSTVGATAICTTGLWWLSGHPPKFDAQGWLWYTSPYARVLEFIVGCTLAHAYRDGYKLGQPFATVAIAWIVLFVLRGFLGNEALSLGMLHFGLLLPIAVLIFSVATSQPFAWLKHPFAVRMGDASYSMYLLHLVVAERLASSIQLADTPTNWSNAIISFVIAIMAIGAISLTSYRFIEVPARRRLRSALSKQAPVSISASAGK